MSTTLSAALSAPAVAALRDAVTGDVHLPGEPGYDAARLPWNRAFEQRPAIIVVPAGTADVAAAVRFARAANLGVAIQATGHGISATADGGLLLVTTRMTDVAVDAHSATATLGAGVTWGPVLAAAQEVGLAPLLGSAPHVGAVGYTLGGGMGWLARKHGLAIDQVRAFEVVTADGRVLEVSPTSHPDLFWALRGGGAGSLAIVTRMTIGLVPVTTVYAGNLLYPADQAAEVMARWRDWIVDVPEELTSSVSVMNFPPFEEVPEPVRGRSFVIVRGCWSGPIADGEALLAHWRDWRTPELDLFGPMPFALAGTISNDPVDPMPGMSTSEWLVDLADEAIAAIMAATLPRQGPPALIFSEIRHAGGAIARGSGAYGVRGGRMVLQSVGVTPTPEARLAVAAQIDELKAAVARYTSGAPYLNFLEGEEKRARTAAAFPPDTWRRLAAVKAAYDPDDVLRYGIVIGAAG